MLGLSWTGNSTHSSWNLILNQLNYLNLLYIFLLPFVLNMNIWCWISTIVCVTVSIHMPAFWVLTGTNICIDWEMYIFRNCIIFSPFLVLICSFRIACTCSVQRFVNTFSVLFNKNVKIRYLVSFFFLFFFLVCKWSSHLDGWKFF